MIRSMSPLARVSAPYVRKHGSMSRIRCAFLEVHFARCDQKGFSEFALHCHNASTRLASFACLGSEVERLSLSDFPVDRVCCAGHAERLALVQR